MKQFAVLVLVALAAGGCSSPQKGPMPVPDPRATSGENREWWDIYSVNFQGDRKVRTRVGYLYRKYGPEDPKGKYWVRDVTMKYVGFILPDDYKAYRIVEARPPLVKETTELLGSGDLDGGIKRILGARGTVEREKVTIHSEPGSPVPSAASVK
jgi:hypothetical protein